MKRSLAAILPLLAVAMIWNLPGAGTAYAQTQSVPLVGGQTPSSVPGGPIIGQPPAPQAVIPPGYSPPSAGARPTDQPGYPSGGAKTGNALIKEKLDRTNREAADLDRDGRISPEEASRLPLGTSLQ